MKQNKLLVILITGLLLLGAVHAVSAKNTVSFDPVSPQVYIGDTTEISIVFDEIAPEGFSGCEFNIALSNPDAAVLIEDVIFPDWATNHLNVLCGDDDLFVSVSDGANIITPGNTDVTLVTFRVKGIAPGSTDISIGNPNFDTIAPGKDIPMTLNDAHLTVTERVPDITVDAAGNGDYTAITDAGDNAPVNDGTIDSTAEEGECISVSPEDPHITFDPVSCVLSPGEDVVYTITLDKVPAGLSGFNLTVSLSDPLVGEISAVNMPSWSTMSDNSSVPASSVWIKGTDICMKVQPGVTDVLLASINFTGLSTGSADISLDVTRMDDDDGYPIRPTTGTAQFTVKSSVPLGDISLAKGWNLISLPGSDAKLTIPEDVQETVHVYDPIGQKYVATTIDALEPGKGCWVAALEDCTITVSGTPVEQYTADLRQGWNLIGGAYRDLSLAGMQTTPAGAVPGYVYAYDPATQRYVQTTTLSPCGGYWMLAFFDCEMNVT